MIEETSDDDGLISDWAAVRRACGRFDKRWQWNNETRSSVVAQNGRQTQNERQEPQPLRSRNDELGQPIGGATIEEVADMLQEMTISRIKKEDSQSFSGRRRGFPRRCIWCDSLEHQRRECSKFQNVIR